MTRKDAIELEKRCEKYISEALGERCVICMALIGALKVRFGDKYFNLRQDCDGNWKVTYVKFEGDYGYLKELIGIVTDILTAHTEEFEWLFWSYENRNLLTEE